MAALIVILGEWGAFGRQKKTREGGEQGSAQVSRKMGSMIRQSAFPSVLYMLFDSVVTPRLLTPQKCMIGSTRPSQYTSHCFTL